MSVPRFRLKSILLFIFIWILIGIIYVNFHGIYLWHSTKSSNDTLNTADFDASTLSIEQTMLCWKSIFESNIISQHIQIESTRYPKPNACITEMNKLQLISFLSATDLFLKHIINSHHPRKYIKYRDIIILRRIIGIIFHQKAFYQHSAYKQFLHTIDTLMNCNEYKLLQLNKTYYNIHISKSGGTSICGTFTHLPFDGIKTPDKSVCNYRWSMQSMSCSAQYIKGNKYDMMARENAMDMFYDEELNSYHPKLCDNFIYLLPFRHPLEKAFSWAQSVNPLTIDARTQFYKRIKNKDIKFDVPCLERPIIINGIPYKRVLNGDDFKEFFVELLNAENETETLLYSHHDFQSFSKRFNDESKVLNVTLDECYKEIKEYNEDDWIYEFIDKQNKIGSLFMCRRNSKRYPFAGLRLGKSSTSNTFTSWLGFGDKSEWILSGQMNPRYIIKQEHYINAVWLLLGIDHILPFWRFYKRDVIDNGEYKVTFGMKSLIWRKTYDDILKHFEENEYIKNTDKLEYWSYIGHNEGRKDMINAENVANGVTKEDVNVLRKYNMYDIELFTLSQWIAKIDVESLNKMN